VDDRNSRGFVVPSGQHTHVSRRRVVERAALFGASIPALGGLLLSATAPSAQAAPAGRATTVHSSDSDSVSVFVREFRLKELPTFSEGPVLFLARRVIARDSPIVEFARPGVALYYVAALPEGGYLELIHNVLIHGNDRGAHEERRQSRAAGGRNGRPVRRRLCPRRRRDLRHRV
jgi:hypothetical protein